ncbi:MAG: efflux RND transporter permease subunit [Marinifilaceae bacterium]
MHKFINNIISFSLRNHLFVLFLTLVLFVAGVYSYLHTPIEAYPDVTNTRVKVIAQWPGRSAEEVEKFLTLPITQQLNTIPRKTDVRSTSLFGLSVINVLFEDGVEDFYAQQYASNRIMGLNLPEGVELEIEPPSGATGEIFRYILRSDLPIKDVSAINEWVVQRELLSVPGVATIASFGGEEKIYEVKVNPTELDNYGITPLQVYEAIATSNVNVGGDIIKKGSQAFVVRGLGLLESVEDIENTLIEVRGSTPVRVKQVARVEVGAKPRQGQVGFNDTDDVVQGIVIMLRGENPTDVITRLKEKITELNERILPDDIRIEPFMDRTKLVDTTVKTVLKNMLEGIILVTVIVFLFLYNWRTTLIVSTVIPLSFLFAIIMLRIQGLPANLISMGALDFGLLLEGTLVIVEIVYVALAGKSRQLGSRFKGMSKNGIIKKSAQHVAAHIFFAQLILMVALSPIFAFQKVEGKMFSPLAFTLGYALLGSLILSLTYVPVMCKMLLRKEVKETSNVVSRALITGVEHCFEWSGRHRRATLVGFAILLVACFARFSFWGTEFIPSMNEGAIYVRATLPNSINLDESVELTQQMKVRLQQFEEIEFILTQTGRPNDGTDATGFFNIEFHIELKPDNEWTRNIGKDALIEEISEALTLFPGMNLAFSQPIQDNVEEYVAGVKSALVIKIFGNDLYELEEIAGKTAASIKDIRGVEDVNVFKSIGLPELQIQLLEERMATYAVSKADAQAVIEMAIGGKAASSFYEGERTFDIVVRYDEPYRDDEIKIGNIQIPTMDGAKVPLREIADIGFKSGPAFIYRDGNSRYIGVGFSIRDRDLGSTIREAQKRVEEQVQLNTENKMEWSGEFESQNRAIKRLSLIVPVALLSILFLLYLNFGNVKDTVVAASTMSYAFVGGFISLWVTGTVFGISSGIGFIILFGIVSIDSILLIANMKHGLLMTHDLRYAINHAVKQRIRPVLMIALMGATGLLPAALSNGMGSEVQKPLAIMIVGGIVICMLLSFTVTPQLFYWAYKNDRLSSRKRKVTAHENINH